MVTTPWQKKKLVDRQETADLARFRSSLYQTSFLKKGPLRAIFLESLTIARKLCPVTRGASSTNGQIMVAIEMKLSD
jgi:hypothetical protein